MLYNVRWNTSETKKVYQATKNSELLMEHLEKSLLEAGIVKLIGEKPTPIEDMVYSSTIIQVNRGSGYYHLHQGEIMTIFILLFLTMS